MTTATLTRSATRTAGGYGFRSVARMEWLKLRSVRSTAWVLLVFAAGMIGLAILVMAHQHWATMSAADRASFDPTNNSFAGLAIGQLALGVLGVLAITSEFSSGMIRATLAAVPRRPAAARRQGGGASARSRWSRGRSWPSPPSPSARPCCGPRPRTPRSASRACCGRC